MNAKETLQLFEWLKIRWPNFKVDDNLDLMVEVYQEDLGEFTYDEVCRAYRDLPAREFAPAVLMVRQKILDSRPDTSDAWMRRYKPLEELPDHG